MCVWGGGGAGGDGAVLQSKEMIEKGCVCGGVDGAVLQDVAQHPLLLHAPWVGWYPG